MHALSFRDLPLADPTQEFVWFALIYFIGFAMKATVNEYLRMHGCPERALHQEAQRVAPGPCRALAGDCLPGVSGRAAPPPAALSPAGIPTRWTRRHLSFPHNSWFKLLFDCHQCLRVFARMFYRCTRMSLQQHMPPRVFIHPVVDSALWMGMQVASLTRSLDPRPVSPRLCPLCPPFTSPVA